VLTLKLRKRQDIFAALYTATSIMSSPFTIHEQNEELANGFPSYIFFCMMHHDKPICFINEIIKSRFLTNLHHDCLTLYLKIVQMDLPLRSAFFHDYADEGKYIVPARVSTDHFDSCNNYYKDLAEVFSRQLTLLAGLNNIFKREIITNLSPR
jgi:hypothetical protein